MENLTSLGLLNVDCRRPLLTSLAKGAPTITAHWNFKAARSPNITARRCCAQRSMWSRNF